MSRPAFGDAGSESATSAAMAAFAAAEHRHVAARAQSF